MLPDFHKTNFSSPCSFDAHWNSTTQQIKIAFALSFFSWCFSETWKHSERVIEKKFRLFQPWIELCLITDKAFQEFRL